MTNKVKTMKHEVFQGAHMGGSLDSNRALYAPAALSSLYTVDCFDRHGVLRWTETVRNLVVDEGLDDILNKYLKGSSYTASWFVGLVDNAGFSAIAAGDTAAGIAASPGNAWDELTNYSEGEPVKR